MTIEKIATDEAPVALGPYSQGIAVNNLVFCSGQIAVEPKSGQVVTGGIKAETHQVMQNLKAVLKKAGSGFEHLIKVQIFLSDLEDFTAVNEIYASYLKEPYPARICMEASKLPLGVAIEIDAIAMRP